MSPFVILTFFLVLGSAAGFLAGLLGIGGGIILVPLFLWGFELGGVASEVQVHLAFGTSLAIIIPTAIASTLAHRRRGNVDWHQVYPLGAGGVLGAVLGASLAATLKGGWLATAFGIMQIVVALQMLIFHPRLPPENPVPPSLVKLLSIGLVGGFFSAFFGIGGGVVAVPLMVILLGFPIHLAVGNSSALIVISSLFGTLSYAYHGLEAAAELLPVYSLGYVNLAVVAAVAPFSIVFARLGARLAGRISHAKLLLVFAGLLVLVGLRMIWKSLLTG